MGCEKLDQMLYGTKFLVLNDHKPLKNIFMKNINKAPPRIQRFMMRLQRYDSQMEYAPGRTIVAADTLSRAYLANEESEISEEEMPFEEVPFAYGSSTYSDVNGWPVNAKHVDEKAQ